MYGFFPKVNVSKEEFKIYKSAKAGYIGFTFQINQNDFHLNSSNDIGRKIKKTVKKEINKRNISLCIFLYLFII